MAAVRGPRPKWKPLLLASLVLAAAPACKGDGHLRGSVAPSADGRTWLVVADDNGGHCGPLTLDGRPWDHPIGERGAVEPGVHTLACGGEIEFTIPAGVVFTFDYWGP